MAIIKKTVLVFIVLLFLSSCTSKRYAKKGLQLEQAGMYGQATEMYYQSVIANSNNVEAKIGLKKNGQLFLDDELARFEKFYNENYKKEAVYKYLECRKVYNKILRTGIELSIPSKYNDYYIEVKKNYLEERYNDAYLFLEEEQFAEAEKIFNEILKIQPEYQDVKELKNIARYEPLYRQAKELMKIGKNRKAYYRFKKILNKQTNYKNTKELCNEALDKATLTIAIAEFKNKHNQYNINNELRADIHKEIARSSNPFIKLIDRDNIDNILREQLYALEKNVNPNLSAPAGKILGAKAILVGEIISCKLTRGSLKKETKKAYLKEKIVKKVGEEEVVSYKYDKTTYTEFSMTRTINCTFQYKLISAETGMVLLANSVSKYVSDAIRYATFEGDVKKLVPGYWEKKYTDSPKDKIQDNIGEVNRLRNKIKARKVIKTTSQLRKELCGYVSKKVSDRIERYDPEN